MNKTKVVPRKRRDSKTSAGRSRHESIKAVVKKKTERSPSRKQVRSTRRLSTSVTSRKTFPSTSPAKREEEITYATQRYADLYRFAQNAYVSLNPSGRIAGINLTAARLFGLPRERLIGRPFSVLVAHEDNDLLQRHLLRCRCSEEIVETELRLKNGKRELINVHLSTLRVTGAGNGGTFYQTTIVDLTERKRFEETIQRSEERYRTLFNLVPVAVYTCDADGIIREYNRRAVELWGCEPTGDGEEPRFCGSYKIYYPDGRLMPHHECPTARALRGEKLTPEDLEIMIERPNGERRHVVPAPRILTDKQGKITGAINCLFDITDRKRAERAASRLAAAVHSSHDAVAAKTLDGIITDWNQSAERIFGYKAKEIIGKSVLTLIPKDRQDEEKEILRRIRRGESLDHYETVRRRKDGQLIDVSLTISPIKGPNGEILGVSKIARDITNQKQTERRLAEQARLLDLTSDAIIVRDRQDRIVYWNRGAEKIYGFSAKEALGKITHELLQTTHPEGLRKIRENLVRNNHWSGEVIHTRKDGRKVVVMSRWSLDRDGRGKPMSILETNTDITARKRTEVELRRSKDLLERVVEQRTKELRIANTELKNEIERRKGLEGEILSISDREQQRLGQELHDGLCQHLTAVAFMSRSIALRLKNHRVIEVGDIEKIAQLVNDAATDTRNLSRALHRLDVDAAGLVVALQDLVDREIWRTPCRLEVKPSFRIEDDAAAAHLYRIAREAVINANKHAQAREIIVRLQRSRREMVLHVIDNGVGLSDERKLKQGLGLHIMNYRAQLAGGRLEINSPKTGGTCVSCYLPYRVSPSRNAKNGEQPAGRTETVPSGVGAAVSKFSASTAAGSSEWVKEE